MDLLHLTFTEPISSLSSPCAHAQLSCTSTDPQMFIPVQTGGNVFLGSCLWFWQAVARGKYLAISALGDIPDSI